MDIELCHDYQPERWFGNPGTGEPSPNTGALKERKQDIAKGSMALLTLKVHDSEEKRYPFPVQEHFFAGKGDQGFKDSGDISFPEDRIASGGHGPSVTLRIVTPCSG
jgi:hypothetical protein